MTRGQQDVAEVVEDEHLADLELLAPRQDERAPDHRCLQEREEDDEGERRQRLHEEDEKKPLPPVVVIWPVVWLTVTSGADEEPAEDEEPDDLDHEDDREVDEHRQQDRPEVLGELL